MKRLRGLGIIVVALSGACNAFSSGDEAPLTNDTTDVDAGSDAATGGGSDGGSVDGPVADDSFAVKIDAKEFRVTQGKTVQVPVTVTRGKDAKGPIAVTVKGLPSGVLAGALSIDGTSGVLELSASTSAEQGPIDAKVEASLGKQTSLAALDLFVRGPSGSLDTTFGNKGSYAEKAGGSTALALVPEPTGTFIVAYRCPIGICLHRLTKDGAIDPTYGDQGTGSIGMPVVDPPVVQSARRSDGSVVLGFSGQFIAGGGIFDKGSIGVVTRDGHPDSSFGSGAFGPGTMASPLPAGGIGTLVVAPDDSIFVVTWVSHIGVTKCSKFGAKDETFGVQQPAIKAGHASDEKLIGATLGDHGNVIVLGVGRPTGDNGAAYYGVVSLEGIMGTIDPAFGTGGRTTVDLPAGDATSAVGVAARLAGGGIVAALGVGAEPLWWVSFAKNGLPDAALGNGSGRTGPFTTKESRPRALAATPTGPVMRLDEDASGNSLVAKRWLVRMTAAGVVDETFGSNGRAPVPSGYLGALQVQNDGRILVTGTSSTADGPDDDKMVVSRYWD